MRQDDDASWSNPKILLVLVLIFVCGTAVGSAITQRVIHSRITRTKSMEVQLKDLKSSLSLTAEQQQIVNKELDDYAKYYQNIEEERANVARYGKERIFKVLTPEQQKKFNEIFEHLPH
jgi:Spy/CpxP family protein refolding chaperone